MVSRTIDFLAYIDVTQSHAYNQGRSDRGGGVTPSDDCSYEQFQVNSGRFAEEIQVNQRKFR